MAREFVAEYSQRGLVDRHLRLPRRRATRTAAPVSGRLRSRAVAGPVMAPRGSGHLSGMAKWNLSTAETGDRLRDRARREGARAGYTAAFDEYARRSDDLANRTGGRYAGSRPACNSMKRSSALLVRTGIGGVAVAVHHVFPESRVLGEFFAMFGAVSAVVVALYLLTVRKKPVSRLPSASGFRRSSLSNQQRRQHSAASVVTSAASRNRVSSCWRSRSPPGSPDDLARAITFCCWTPLPGWRRGSGNGAATCWMKPRHEARSFVLAYLRALPAADRVMLSGPMRSPTPA